MTIDQLNLMKDEKLIDLWNDYCDAVNYHTDIIYHNDDEAFDTYGFTINGTIINSKNGGYDWNHKWIASDGYGNPISADDPRGLMDLDALLEYLQNQHEA